MDLFQVSSLIIFFASLVLGLFVYSNNRESKLNRSWFLLSLAVAIWGLGLWGVTYSSKSESAMIWQYILDAGAVFIPVLYFNFVLIFLNLEDRKKTARRVAFLVGMVLFFLSFSPLFKKGVMTKFGFHWIDPGILYFLFPLTFAFYVIYSLVLFLKQYKKGDELLKNQIKYMIFALIFGFGGGATNFFPQFFDVYPFGNYFVILYVFFMGYPVLVHKLFNVKVVATEFFVGVITLAFLFNIFISESLTDWFVSLFLFIIIVVFSVLTIRSVLKEVESRERISKLAESLKKANAELQRLDKAKSEFLSIASHQLRTPLSIIKGFLSMILEGSYGQVPGKIRDKLSKSLESNERLIKLVDDLLDLSHMEDGKMKFNFGEISINKMVKSCVEELEIKASEKGLKFIYHPAEEEMIVKADEEKIRQVAVNLIDNAIKYTEKGSVEVFLEEIDNEAVFSVKDTGIGVSSDDKDQLFRKFIRGRKVSRVWTEGAGLGLYVARLIVEAHQGQIGVRSEGEGKGSEFWFKVPIVRIGEGKEKSEEKDEKASNLL